MKADVPRTHENYNVTYAVFHLCWILEITRRVKRKKER